MGVGLSNRNLSCSVGDIIAVRGAGWVAETIERVTGSKYSHVAVYVGEGQFVEAQGFRTVGFQSLSFYEQYDVYRLKQPITIEQASRMDKFLHDSIGDQYDYVDIAILLIRYLFKLKLPWHETKKFICSMLIYRAYRYAGIKLCNEENVSPEDIVESPLLYKVN